MVIDWLIWFFARVICSLAIKNHIYAYQILRPRSSSRSEDLFAVATERELGRAGVRDCGLLGAVILESVKDRLSNSLWPNYELVRTLAYC